MPVSFAGFEPVRLRKWWTNAVASLYLALSDALHRPHHVLMPVPTGTTSWFEGECRRAPPGAHQPSRAATSGTELTMPPSANTAGGRRVTRWTRETIIEKILEWNDRFGEPPCSADWNPSLARWRAQEWRVERYRDGIWPSTNAAKRPFDGSFDAAVRAAGLEPHRSGPRRRPAGVARPAVEQRAPQAPRSVDEALLEASERVRARGASCRRAGAGAGGGRASRGSCRGPAGRCARACPPGERA